MTAHRTYGPRDDVEKTDRDAVFRGVNLRLAPEKLPPGYLADAENVRMTDGDVAPRPGLVKPGWLNVTNAAVGPEIGPVTSFYGVGVFRDPNSIEWVLIAADGLIYRCRPGNARYALPMPHQAVRVLGECTLVQAFNWVFCFRGRYLAPLVLRSMDSGWEDLLPLWAAASTYAAGTEVAYGPFQAVMTPTAPITLGAGELTSSGTTATVAHVAHGFADGDVVTIRGAVPTQYNGHFQITWVDADHFTYTLASTGATPATGTITLRKTTVESDSDLVTVVTAAAHGYITGADLTISGAAQTEYNGRFNITVVDEVTFTYRFAGSATTPATGTITCSNMSRYYAAAALTSAGESPDTHAAKWTRVYTVLPNATTALFLNNRLLIPTAYTPGGADAAPWSSASYTKADFLVAADIFDPIHFGFVNEFRINQGDDSEILDLVKYDNNNVLIFKERCWGVLSGIQASLAYITLDMRAARYGLCARGAAVVAGKDVLFVSSSRGVVSIRQTEQGLLQSVDLPFSNEIDPWIQRINWNLAGRIRAAWWNDKLYVAAAMDDATVNNVLLVYDFRAQAWAGRDTGAAICPQEFILATWGGRERLFFLGTDGFVSLLEEDPGGDQVRDLGAAGGLSTAAIATRAVTRGYRHEELAPKKFPSVELGLAVWNARFSVTANTGAARGSRALVANQSFSRTAYLRPFDALPWDSDNSGLDFDTPFRGNYSVALSAGGFQCGGGLQPDQFQDVFLRQSARTLDGQFIQFTVTSDQGRCKLKSVAPAARPGPRRSGILV